MKTLTWSRGVAQPVAASAETAESRFEALYRRHHRDVLAYFIRRVPHRDAEDAASEVFSVAWRRIDEIPTGDGAPAWLFGVAHNTLAHHRRGWRRAKRLTRRLAGLAGEASITPEMQVVRSDEDDALLQALSRIKPAHAEVLRLATWELLSHRAIGDTLGISEAAASQRISRARKHLAKELKRIESKRQLSISLRSERKEA